MDTRVRRQVAILIAIPLLVALCLRSLYAFKLQGVMRFESAHYLQALIWLPLLCCLLIGVLAAFLWPPMAFAKPVVVTAVVLIICLTALILLPFYSYVAGLHLFSPTAISAIIDHHGQIAALNVLPVQVLVAHLRFQRQP